MIEAPPGGGKIVSAEWDFAATSEILGGDKGRFPLNETFNPAQRVVLTRQFTFDKPGTYFPAIRVHSQREGDAKTAYARLPNLGRVRVVVS